MIFLPRRVDYSKKKGPIGLLLNSNSALCVEHFFYRTPQIELHK